MASISLGISLGISLFSQVAVGSIALTVLLYVPATATRSNVKKRPFL